MIHNFYKFEDGTVLEVLEEEISENSNAVLLKVNRYISCSSPCFIMKDHVFFKISLKQYSIKEEISEKDFLNLLESETKRVWEEILKKDDGYCFELDYSALSTRYSFMKTHNLDKESFFKMFEYVV